MLQFGLATRYIALSYVGILLRRSVSCLQLDMSERKQNLHLC
jgi:hypothetical protein